MIRHIFDESRYWGVTEEKEKSETVVALGLSESFPTFLPSSVVDDAIKLKNSK